MTLFNFRFTDNYSNITRNIVFREYFKKSIIICIITLFIGIVIGYWLGNGYTISAVKYVVVDSGSAQLMIATEHSNILRFLATFFNNLLVAGLLLIIPIHIFNLIKAHTDNWTKKSYLTLLNPIWIGYLLVSVQMLMVGNFIGFALPIINNIGLVIMSLVPHGIIEIPIILASGAVGMSFASKSDKFNFTFNDVSNFFIRIVIPIIMIAAFTETFITPIFVSLI
jgi:uncharacterized membrane protein SpoIIM required for sporulation